MNCPHCKRKISHDSIYCQYCGYHLYSSDFTNFLIRSFIKLILKVNMCFRSCGLGFMDLYYQHVAKRYVQKSRYMKADTEQRNLFNIPKTHKSQLDRINSFVEAALQRGYVDYIEGWQSHRVGRKQYVVSYRYVDPQGIFKYWYWMVDFSAGIIKEITKKASEMEKFRIRPSENTAFIDFSVCSKKMDKIKTPQQLQKKSLRC